MNQQRQKAYEILLGIYLHEDYSNLSLRKALQETSEEERRWITQVVYGTVENFRYVRWCWEDLVKRQPSEEIAVLFDMSVYQLLFMEHKADHAILHDAVEIVKRKGEKKQAGFVNAILRSVLRRGKKALPQKKAEALSIETSHPLWLIKMWNAQYGEEICEKICRSNMKPRNNVARVNTLKITREELLQKEPRFQASTLSKDGVRYQGALARSEWFLQGYVAMQDEASQCVVEYLDPMCGQKVLDVCSAPGTKACHIAQRMQDQGSILCGDIHEHRVKLIEEGAKKLGITCIQARCMDASVLEGLKEESFDRVLCDVPCSGYGTLSRKSDIKLRMQSSDMDALIPLQQKILTRSSAMVKPNGILVYATCTLNKKENEKQIETFLKQHPEFVLEKQQTIFPYEYDCDGFYMAKLRRQ